MAGKKLSDNEFREEIERLVKSHNAKLAIIDQPIKTEKLTLSISEAAKRLGISDTTMRNLAKTEGFPSFQVGYRILISAKGLEAWVEKQATSGAQV